MSSPVPFEDNDPSRRAREVFHDWAETGRADRMATSHGPSARAAFDRLTLMPGQRYLDIGCGTGYTLAWAAEAVGDEGHVLGIDVAPGMVAAARSQLAALAPVRVLEGAWPDVGSGAGPFDAIFSMEVFYYLRDLPGALKAVHDALRPGGRFALVIDHYRENVASHSWSTDLAVPMHLLAVAEWEQAFRAADLVVRESTRLRAPVVADEPVSWKHEQGSLFLLGVRGE